MESKSQSVRVKGRAVWAAGIVGTWSGDTRTAWQGEHL